MGKFEGTDLGYQIQHKFVLEIKTSTSIEGRAAKQLLADIGFDLEARVFEFGKCFASCAKQFLHVSPIHTDKSNGTTFCNR